MIKLLFLSSNVITYILIASIIIVIIIASCLIIFLNKRANKLIYQSNKKVYEEELLPEAKELNIEVDPTWSATQLAEKIEAIKKVSKKRKIMNQNKINNKLEQIYYESIENHSYPLDFNSLTFIKEKIKEKKIKTILELGTGLGYSSINFSLLAKDIKITTLEKNDLTFLKAKINVNFFNLDKQINMINVDFINYKNIENIKYDLLFLDGPKSSFFNQIQQLSPYLKDDGIIIIDNINLERIDLKDQESKILKEKVELFKLKAIKNWNAKVISIGDGLLFIEKNRIFFNK